MANYTNDELKQRYPSHRKQLTVSHPEIAPGDADLAGFARACDAAGLDVATANKLLALLVEEKKATKEKKP